MERKRLKNWERLQNCCRKQYTIFPTVLKSQQCGLKLSPSARPRASIVCWTPDASVVKHYKAAESSVPPANPEAVSSPRFLGDIIGSDAENKDPHFLSNFDSLWRRRFHAP